MFVGLSVSLDMTLYFSTRTRKSSCVTARGIPPAAYPVYSVLCPGGGEGGRGRVVERRGGEVEGVPCPGLDLGEGYPCPGPGPGVSHVLVLTRLPPIPPFSPATTRTGIPPQGTWDQRPGTSEQGIPSPLLTDKQNENFTLPRTSYAGGKKSMYNLCHVTVSDQITGLMPHSKKLDELFALSFFFSMT